MTLTPSQQTRFVDFINKHGISGERYDFAFTVYKLACAEDVAADVVKEAAIRLELENQRAKQNFELRAERLAGLIRAGHKFDWPFTDAFDDGGVAYHEAKRRIAAGKEPQV